MKLLSPFRHGYLNSLFKNKIRIFILKRRVDLSADYCKQSHPEAGKLMQNISILPVKIQRLITIPFPSHPFAISLPVPYPVSLSS